MSTILRNGIIIAIFLFVKNPIVCSQLNLSNYEVGLNIGTYLYQGDLTPSLTGSLKTPGFGFMFYANRVINKSFFLRTNFAYAKVKGDDAKYSRPSYRQQRNLSFSSPLFEISELFVWNVFGKNSSKRGNMGLSPYLFGGVGFTFLHIKRDWSRFNAEFFAQEPDVQTGLNTDIASSLPKVIPVIPLGIGVQYALSPQISILAESSYRITRTDYLDGFSKVANPGKKDSYNSHSVGLVYKFRKNNMFNCPVIR